VGRLAPYVPVTVSTSNVIELVMLRNAFVDEDGYSIGEKIVLPAG
jgi:hypothetical protein